MKKKNGLKRKMARLGKAGGKKSAAKLTPEQRSQRSRHAALVRYGAEQSRDELEAQQTASTIRRRLFAEAFALVEQNEKVPVRELTERLRKQHKFYLTSRTAAQLIVDAAHALDMRRHLGLLRVSRAGQEIGVIDPATLELKTENDDLRSAFNEARTSGMGSLGDIDAPPPPPGLIIDHWKVVPLVAGDIASVYELKRWLEGKNFHAEFTNVVVAKDPINPRFVADHCFATPIEPKQK